MAQGGGLPRTLARSRIVLVLVVGALLLAAAAWVSRREQAVPVNREAAIRATLEAVHVSVLVGGSTLAIATAISDTLEGGVHLRRVRIVDELRLELRIEADRLVTLAGTPRVCLVWPSSAPDDAGLSDRCWGDPDIGAIAAAKLAVDDTGRATFDPAVPVTVALTLSRGETRCDYPPGEWHAELTVDPVVDGAPAGQHDVPFATFNVPYLGATIVRDLSSASTRFCGLANSVYRDQGEPPTPKP
jgi:hypothetical protein